MKRKYLERKTAVQRRSKPQEKSIYLKDCEEIMK